MPYFSTDVPRIISKEFDDELVLANYDSGLYYSLADSAAKIWLALKAGASDQAIVAAFTRKFPAAAGIETEVGNFIQKLVAEGLIVPAEKGNEGEPLLEGLPDFRAPVLERFDDLKELLLLDPVHDVDDAGWPVKAEDAR
ncbi:MAG TPA: PqqD family protein [Xanthobacteraceae bacterium]|nr:PqqD family protein [Xanthobacteraceae bacterium]